MTNDFTDPKKLAILEASWAVFATYGFRKTSMDDIAREARMSRPALYQHYRNKEDISRSLVRHHYQQAAERVGDILTSEGDLTETLARAFAAQGGKAMEVVLTSPHGMEMLDTGSQVAADIVAEGERHLAEVYAGWLEAGAAQGRVRLATGPQEMASALTAALKGAKLAATDYADYEARLTALAQIFAAALAPR